MIVYKIQNKLNNKIYIGITKRDLSIRIAEHIKAKSPLGYAFCKYGIQCFDISVIDASDDYDNLLDKEMEYIVFYNSKIPNGYNQTDGGEGLEMTEIIKNKISTGLKGKPKSEEHKQKVIAANTGRKHSIESKEKMSKAKLGCKLSDECKQKISNSLKGKSKSEEHTIKVRMANIGKKRSEESKKKMSEAAKRNKWTEEQRKKFCATMKGHVVSKETREKISKSNMGHPGFGKGIPRSEETKKRISEARKKKKITL